MIRRLMSMVHILIPVLIVFVLAGCQSGRCSESAKNWIKEAPQALEEFLVVKQEILSNRQFLDSVLRDSSVFIYDLHVQTKFNTPNFDKWIKNGRGYISFKKNDTTVLYRQCQDAKGIIYAKLHFGPFNRSQYHDQVRILDTVQLRNGWFAEVSECRGCGD